MNSKQLNNTSKFISLLLRHQPETIGLQLDENGWALVSELITKMDEHQHSIDQNILETIVTTSDKQRFIFNEDKTKIRANQGHSIAVDLNLKEMIPPAILYHGTVSQFISLIKNEGLKKMSRQHVHLSADYETAVKVGSRRGEAIILQINANEMYKENYKFYQSENGVWLSDHIPSKFISF